MYKNKSKLASSSTLGEGWKAILMFFPAVTTEFFKWFAKIEDKEICRSTGLYYSDVMMITGECDCGEWRTVRLRREVREKGNTTHTRRNLCRQLLDSYNTDFLSLSSRLGRGHFLGARLTHSCILDSCSLGDRSEYSTLATLMDYRHLLGG